ncbi:MAG: adenylate/guanylate cyclase domain-containing protein, partial [Anaerolineae bacterium]|nr:adenylate/guanylate cyclase domain-containing protein [Anaerolineae bacterium]MCB0239642.1 adenylate/guanylate cyclase domain-containing protein [Anaerolineae bacterium]
LRKQLAELEASPPDEQRKLVTVLFADLAGFTALSERMDPEEMRELQDAYFAAIAKPIEDYGGSVEKYIGDAVLAVFGVPETHEDDAERAVHAALAMQGALDNLNRRRASEGEETSPLRLRIGIHTGLVVSRVDEDGDFVITGDTVNLASRLQSAAEPGMVLISADVYKLVCHVFETTDLGAIALKGRAEPVRGFSV